MTTFTNPHERIEQLMLKIERLERAGDVLAHNLTFPTYEPELSAWWNLRGGVDACTVCNPAETSVQPTVEQRAKQLFLSMHGITEGLWEAQSEIEKDKWRGHIAASQSKTKGDDRG